MATSAACSGPLRSCPSLRLLLVQLGEALGHRVFREPLDVAVQRRIDAEAARQRAIDAELFEESFVHEAGEVPPRGRAHRIHLGAQRSLASVAATGVAIDVPKVPASR